MNYRKTKYIILALLIVLFVGGLYYLTQDKEQKSRNIYPQEFKNLSVVQFYLHMAGRDYIIGSQDKSFNKVFGAVQTAVLSIDKPLPEVGLFDQKSIQDINAKAVSLSVWLVEPQKISTKVKGSTGSTSDKYGNRVIVSDRIFLVLGGKFQGKVFTRDSQSGQWQVWDTASDGFMPLIEAVKDGGL